jgi:hypothetical protein
MFKVILAIGLWVAVISFAATVILYIYSMFEPSLDINNLYYLAATTSWSFYVSIVSAAAVVIFSKKSQKQNQ